MLSQVPSAGCNDGYVPTSGSQATGGSDGSTGPTDTSDASTIAGATGSDTQAAGDDTTTGGSTSTSGASSTTGAEPYPEECLEPEALIDVMSAITPDGPLTIDEAWLGGDFCSGHPYVVLVQYSTPETLGAEVTLMVQPERPVDGPYFGVYPLQLVWQASPVGTIDIVEPLEGDVGVRHLHGLIEVHGEGWDLSLEVDLLDCGVWECFCPCR